MNHTKEAAGAGQQSAGGDGEHDLILAWALKYLKCGWNPVPVKYRTADLLEEVPEPAHYGEGDIQTFCARPFEYRNYHGENLRSLCI